MTSVNPRLLVGCQDHILGRLRQEMGHRGDDLAWIDRERYVVAVAANEWAQAHGCPTVTVEDVERVEGLAVGHVDYPQKLALYVAELVVPSWRRRQGTEKVTGANE